MRPRWRLIVVVLLAGLALGLEGVMAQGETDNVIIGDRPDNTSRSFALVMPSDQTTATFGLYLQTDTALSNLALLAYLQDDRQQLLPSVTLTFSTLSGEPLASLNLAAGQHRLLMHVGNLNASGTFTGTIGLQSVVTTESPVGAPGLTPVATFTLVKAAQPRLRVQQADNNKAITLIAASDVLSYPLTLIEESGQAEADVGLTIGPITRKDGVAGQAAGLTWSSPAQQGAQVRVEPGGYQVILLSGVLPERAEYTSWLMLRYADQADVYTLNISRTATPGVVVLDAVDNRLALPVSTQDFTRTILLQAPNGQADVTDLEMAVSQPVRIDGQAIAAEHLACEPCEGTAAPLKAGQIMSLTLLGANFKPTSYSAVLRVTYQGQTQALPVSITRMPATSNLSVTAPISVTGYSFFGASVDVEIEVKDLSGVDTSIYYPTGEEAQLARLNGNVTQYFTPVPTETVELPANGITKYTLHWTGLEPGVNVRRIWVLGPNSAEVVKEVTIHVKDSVVLAFVAILAGVWLSFWIHSRARGGRSRDVRSAAIATERENIAKNAELWPDPLWSELADRLRQVEINNRFRPEVTADQIAASIKDIGNRIRNFRQALEARTRVNRLLDTFPETSDELKQARKQLLDQRDRSVADVQTALRADEGKGLGDNAEALLKINALHQLYDRVRATAIHWPAKSLAAQAAQLAAESDDAGVKAAANDIQTKAEQLAVACEPAQTSLSNIDFDTRRAELEALQRRYAELRLNQLEQLMRQLRDELNATLVALPATWDKVDQHLVKAEAALDEARQSGVVDDMLKHWQQGNDQYLLARVEHLAVSLSPDNPPFGIELQEWVSQVAHVTKLVEQARVAGEQGRYSEVQVAYREARDKQLRLQGLALRKRSDACKAAANRPKFVTDQDWAPVAASLQPQLAKLADVDQSQSDESGSLAERRGRFEKARAQFVEAQIVIMDGLHQWLNQYYTSKKDLPENQNDARWAKTLPQDLPKLAEVIRAAQGAWQQSSAAPDRSAKAKALLEAERLAFDAQSRYTSLIELLAAEVRRTYGREREEEKPEVAPALTPIADTLSDIVSAATGALLAPAQALLSNLAAYKSSDQLTAAEWYERIATADRRQAFLVMVVAAFTGLVALWFNRSTFGGQDYVTAFLWGFGLSEAAKGFVAIAESMGTVPPQKQG